MTTEADASLRDDFARDNLPPREQWPDLLLDGLHYPDQLNCVTALLDRQIPVPPGIIVSNRAHLSRVGLLQKEFERIGLSAKDAFSTALQRLPKLPPGTSMLGLARIATEATVRLKVERDQVTVEASIR